MFENKLDSRHQIHYSRYIMSWIREGGNCKDQGGFKAWLKSLKVPDEEIREIWLMMSNGKLELETSASNFIKVLIMGQEEILDEEVQEILNKYKRKR